MKEDDARAQQVRALYDIVETRKSGRWDVDGLIVRAEWGDRLRIVRKDQYSLGQWDFRDDVWEFWGGLRKFDRATELVRQLLKHADPDRGHDLLPGSE
jgi:hypothetical protein